MKAVKLHSKLFLEGMEVPFIGATVTSTVGQATIAYIDLVPLAAINNIKPRTLVQIFTTDPKSNDSDQFKLMFEGEVFGLSFNKTVSSRTTSISAIDYSSYWDNVLTYFFNAMQSLSSGPARASNEGMENADAVKQDIKVVSTTHASSSYYWKIVDETIKAGGDFIDAITAILKELSSINEFYTNADQRLKISKRIYMQSSKNLQELIKMEQCKQWFEGLVGNDTGYRTLRMVLNDLMNVVFHDMVCPAFPTGMNTTNNQSVEKSIPNSFIIKPNLYMLPPPMCNVFYPNEYSSFSFNRNFFTEPTRMIYKPELPSFLNNATAVGLKHVYSPKSFSNFMYKVKQDLTTIGKKPLQISNDQGFYDDPDSGNKSSGGKKREQQFLTNEEKMKGILMTTEGMVPASMQFVKSFDELAKAGVTQKVSDYLFFKKRFEGRDVQITSHLKPSVVAGFPTLIVDDTDADQNVIAYCNSVTHRVYSTQGGYTNVTLTYARTVGEQDATTSESGDPLIPPWFSESVFGNLKNGEYQFGAKLSEFYGLLLGPNGSKAITDYAKQPTCTSAARAIIAEFKNLKKRRGATDELVKKTTSRKYITMNETMAFLGAIPSTSDVKSSFMEYTGGNINGVGSDSEQIAVRKAVITKYRNDLKNNRGFVG